MRKAGWIVHDHTVSSVEVKSVRKATAVAANIERELVPAAEYMAALPSSLRALFNAIFRWGMGGGDAGEDGARQGALAADPAAPAPLAHGGRRNDITKAHILSYSSVTMVVSAVLQRAYRPPHSRTFAQILNLTVRRRK